MEAEGLIPGGGLFQREFELGRLATAVAAGETSWDRKILDERFTDYDEPLLQSGLWLLEQTTGRDVDGTETLDSLVEWIGASAGRVNIAGYWAMVREALDGLPDHSAAVRGVLEIARKNSPADLARLAAQLLEEGAASGSEQDPHDEEHHQADDEEAPRPAPRASEGDVEQTEAGEEEE